jgi:molecular chaperone GrpE (heat shock protein)
MSDMIELSDADFALKMEGLVNEAKLAMEDRAAKIHPPEPAATAEPAAKSEPTPAPAPAPSPAAPEKPRPAASLPEMLRPLVQGVQAVGRVSGEHTQILQRVDKAISDASAASQDLPQIVSDLKALFEQRNVVSRQMFDALHEELKSYKDGFLLDSVHRPMIRDLITLYDDLTQIHEQTQDVVEAAPALADGSALSTSYLARLESLEAHVSHNLEFILEVLARLEVSQLPVGTGKLDKRTQRAMAVEIAEDPDQDMDIVRSLKRGFLWKDRVIRAEEVVMKKWKEGFLMALQTPPT